MLINEVEDLHMQVDGELVTMQSKVWGVRIPNGTWLWQRPLAVQYKDDEIPIDNVTRDAILALLGLSLLVVLFSLFREKYCAK